MGEQPAGAGDGLRAMAFPIPPASQGCFGAGGDTLAVGDSLSRQPSPPQQPLSHPSNPFPAPSVPELLQAGSITPRIAAGRRARTSLPPASVSPLGKRRRCLCTLPLKRTSSFFFPAVLLPCKELKRSLRSRPEQALEGARVYRHVQATEHRVGRGDFTRRIRFLSFGRDCIKRKKKTNPNTNPRMETCVRESRCIYCSAKTNRLLRAFDN